MYRYYNDLKQQESIDFYSEAIRDYNVHAATVPPVSQKHAKDQSRSWKKYLSIIDPKNISGKKKKNPLEELVKTIQIPVTEEKIKKESDSD